jgi:hypothetical protein
MYRDNTNQDEQSEDQDRDEPPKYSFDLCIFLFLLSVGVKNIKGGTARWLHHYHFSLFPISKHIGMKLQLTELAFDVRVSQYHAVAATRSVTKSVARPPTPCMSAIKKEKQSYIAIVVLWSQILGPKKWIRAALNHA